MIAGLRALRTYFTALGAALPPTNGSKHGQVNIKQASVTEDEAYLVLRDSSGVLQYRRLVTTTLGSTLYGVPLVVQEGGVTTDATVGVLNFDASDFTLTEVALAYGTGAGTPAEGNHTHASTLIVQEGGVTTDATVGTINFDGSDFNLTESPEDTVAVALAYGTGAGTPAEGNHLHDSTYVNVTGDTMTGALTIDSDTSPPASIVSGGAVRFLISDADGTTVRYRFSGSAFQIWNSNGISTFSDAGSTQTFQVDGSTGDTTIAGALDHNGTTVGLFGVTPAVRPSAYTVTNLVTDRAYDANATTTAELADVLGTLIADLRTLGIVQ
jgi:hypothetical protein